MDITRFHTIQGIPCKGIPSASGKICALIKILATQESLYHPAGHQCNTRPQHLYGHVHGKEYPLKITSSGNLGGAIWTTMAHAISFHTLHVTLSWQLSLKPEVLSCKCFDHPESQSVYLPHHVSLLVHVVLPL